MSVGNVERGYETWLTTYQYVSNYTKIFKGCGGVCPFTNTTRKQNSSMTWLSFLKTRKNLVFAQLSKLLVVCVVRFLKSIEKSLLKDSKLLECLQYNSNERQDLEVVLLPLKRFGIT